MRSELERDVVQALDAGGIAASPLRDRVVARLLALAGEGPVLPKHVSAAVAEEEKLGTDTQGLLLAQRIGDLAAAAGRARRATPAPSPAAAVEAPKAAPPSAEAPLLGDAGVGLFYLQRFLPVALLVVGLLVALVWAPSLGPRAATRPLRTVGGAAAAAGLVLLLKRWRDGG